MESGLPQTKKWIMKSKNQTLNPSRFIYQNQTKNFLKNPELQIHNLVMTFDSTLSYQLTQQNSIYPNYSKPKLSGPKSSLAMSIILSVKPFAISYPFVYRSQRSDLMSNYSFANTERIPHISQQREFYASKIDQGVWGLFKEKRCKILL